MSKEDLLSIKFAAFKFFLLVIGMLYVPVALYLDVVVIGHRVPEHGVTELSQEFFLLLSALMFTHLAVKLPEQRGFLVMVSGFFWCMFLRELDHDFDRISHGFWKYPVWATVIISLSLAAKFRDSVLAPMAAATRSVSFTYMLIGLALLLFFSRVFGTSSFWAAILEANHYDVPESLIKNVVQEGVELLAYVVILFGAAQFWLINKSGKAEASYPAE